MPRASAFHAAARLGRWAVVIHTGAHDGEPQRYVYGFSLKAYELHRNGRLVVIHRQDSAKRAGRRETKGSFGRYRSVKPHRFCTRAKSFPCTCDAGHNVTPLFLAEKPSLPCSADSTHTRRREKGPGCAPLTEEESLRANMRPSQPISV